MDVNLDIVRNEVLKLSLVSVLSWFKTRNTLIFDLYENWGMRIGDLSSLMVVAR